MLAAATNRAQFADNMEQFIWASSLESGYWKHPPLPSWMLWAVIHTFGFWSGWTYVLSALCLSGTALLTWRVAQRLVGAPVAGIAVLLQGLHLGFSQRAELYNHNTVLLLFSAMTVWAVLRALERGRTRDWLLVGACAGLALLAKYQAIVILSGIFIALVMAGDMKETRVRWGCVWAAAASLLVLSPHLAGLSGQVNSPVTYALSRVQDNSWESVLGSTIPYLVSQIRFHLPMIAAIAFVALTAGGRPKLGSSMPADAMAPERLRAWLTGLVLWPLLFVTLAPVWSGMPLQAQWGLSALQFLVVFLALKVGQAWPQLTTARLGYAVAGVQLLNGLVFIGAPMPPDRRIDTAYPARELANAVLQDWRAQSNCPLKFVVGPSFEAGLVSVYSGSYAKVLEEGDYRKSPWIDESDMRRSGFVVMDSSGGPMWARGSLDRPAAREWPQQLRWVVVSPQARCGVTGLPSDAVAKARV